MHPVLSRLLVFELSHHSAPLQAREGLCWSESVCQQKARQLRAHGLVEDVVLLVTCNRTACIAMGDQPERLWAWWCDNLGDNQRYATRYHDRDALHYLLRMAVGGIGTCAVTAVFFTWPAGTGIVYGLGHCYSATSESFFAKSLLSIVDVVSGCE